MRDHGLSAAFGSRLEHPFRVGELVSRSMPGADHQPSPGVSRKVYVRRGRRLWCTKLQCRYKSLQNDA